MMKRFLREKSSSKAVERTNEDGGTPPSSVKPKKKKKSLFSIFSRKKKDKNSSKGFICDCHERRGSEIAIRDKDESKSSPSNRRSMEVSGERSQMVYQQDSSTLPVGAKSEELASFEFSNTHSPDGSISSGFHEVQPSASGSESLCEPAHRHPADLRHAQPTVVSRSTKPCHQGAFEGDASDDSSAVCRCVTASQSCMTGLKLDSNALLLHPPLRELTVQCRGSEAECDESETVQIDNRRMQEVGLGSATKLWIGQPHPVTFANGTTRLFSWSLDGDRIVGTTVEDTAGKMDASVDHPLVANQSKTVETEAGDSVDDLEVQHGGDQLRSQPGKVTTNNSPPTRERSRLEDCSESTNSEDPQIERTLQPNTSLLATRQTSYVDNDYPTSPEIATSFPCSCDHPESVRPRGKESRSHPDVAEEFEIDITSKITDVSPERHVTTRNNTSPGLRCSSVQPRPSNCEDGSIDEDTGSVFSADAGRVPDRFSENSKMALTECKSVDAVLSLNSSINCAMWFDVGTERSRGMSQEVKGIVGSASSQFFRQSGVARADKRSTLESSKGGTVDARKASSSSTRNLSAMSKTLASRTESIASSVGATGDAARWKSVTDLTGLTPDAYNRPEPSGYDPQVAADLARKFAAVNARFRTMAAEAISRRESGNFKEPNKTQFIALQSGMRTQQTDLELGHRPVEELSWKFEGSLKRGFNQPHQIVSEDRRAAMAKDRTRFHTVDDSIMESVETPEVFETAVVSHPKTALNVRDGRSESRKYSSAGDLRVRFSEDGLSLPSSASSFSNSSSSRGPSNTVNHNRRLTAAGRKQVDQDVAGLLFPSSVSASSNSSSSHATTSGAVNQTDRLTAGVRGPEVQDVDETPVVNRPRKKSMHEQLTEVRSQVDEWHKDLTLSRRLQYANMTDDSM